MARKKSKAGRIITIVVLVIVLIVVGIFLLTKKPKPETSSTTTDSSKSATPTKDTTTETAPSDTNSSTTNSSSATATADPSTLSSVDVAPLGVTVFYSKGTPGFEFSVLKTADQTQYAQFTSPDLIGTKCTDDEGAFATIIKNPSDSEAQTTSQTVKVGNDSYGLSLSSPNCTGNDQLLTEYQTGFKNGFDSLKAL